MAACCWPFRQAKSRTTDWKRGVVADPVWNPAVARIAQIAGASAVPTNFAGANSALFQLAGAVHPRLRTASLPRELLNKRGRIIEVKIGRPVAAKTLASFADAQAATEYLRCLTYALDSSRERRGAVIFLPPQFSHRKPALIASAPPAEALGREVPLLPPEAKLCEAGDLSVYLGSADDLPSVLLEIGRLRETTFRQAGEGSGRAIDLDWFDDHYLHLFLWNRKTREVAGAYRLGPTPEILRRFGPRGLYTNTLFHFKKELFNRMGPAIELGRSFIRVEYQKQYTPLLLLWKAIATYAARRLDCPRLFGAVSISNTYHPVSRHLIVRFLEARRACEFSSLVVPRRPYRPDERAMLRPGFGPNPPVGIDALSDLIAGIESDGKGVPILVKQYLKTGGRLLGFNVDRRFSNVLDAMILVDLREVSPAQLERYLGRSGAMAFRVWHSMERGAA